MKKMATMVLGLMLVLTLAGCGNKAQSSDTHNAEYEEGYAAATIVNGEFVMKDGEVLR